MTSRKRELPDEFDVGDDDSILSEDELLVDIIIVEEKQPSIISTSHEFRVSRSLLASEESASILVPQLLSNTCVPTHRCKRPETIRYISKGVHSLPSDRRQVYIYIVMFDLEGLMEGSCYVYFVRHEEMSVDEAILSALQTLHSDSGPLCNNPCVGTLNRITTEKSIDCAICLEEVPIGTYAALLPCSHAYHRLCIVKWLKKSDVCPVCRFHLPC